MVTSDGSWSARHSVDAVARRTAALVNVLTGEEAPSAAAVAAVLRAHGESGESGGSGGSGGGPGLELPEREVAGMRTAALMLREVFAATGTDEAAERLNRLLPLSTGTLRLTSHGGSSPWHPHLDSHDDAPWGEWLLASSSLALTVLVWDRQRPPGGVCASDGCRNVFLTQGSGPERRYCSRRCATRERVAAHRRAKSPGGPSPRDHAPQNPSGSRQLGDGG
ncbi:CGNR zinc finger domain-containing protein [Streptomyces sp. NPDC014894]|uniref:CGNR zinc finger domain-containing protein n=1 Tax=unclassified Streptomyces TaxID=2593676 RepID=UPI0036F9F6BB